MSKKAPAIAALVAAGALILSACAGPAPAEDAVVAPAPVAQQPTTTAAPSSEPSAESSSKPQPKPAAAPVLERGASGDKVKDLQTRLKQIGWFDGEVTGEYDDATVEAVKGFQAKRNLPQTGIADDKTLEALEAMTSKSSGAQNTSGDKNTSAKKNQSAPKKKSDSQGSRPAAGKALFSEGASGAKVKDLQARLKQVGWFSGEVTGHYGSKTAAAVRGFQGKRNLAQTGKVDRATLDKLYAMTRKPTSDELNNVAKTSENKSESKPKSGQSASGSDNGGSQQAKGLPKQCMTGRVMCISKKSRMLWWVVDGKVRTSFDVRFGKESTPTREGMFSVNRKSRNHVSNQYFTAMPFAMFFSGGQAVHYSADFAANGYNGASHGCVNVRARGKIAKLYDQVRLGDKVYVYR